jgi:multiple sugar transport system permease protein
VRNLRSEQTGYWFILPWLLGLLLFTLGPMLFSLMLAFCKWDIITGLSSIEWVGLDNFKQMFQDNLFYQSLRLSWRLLYQAALSRSLA